MKKIILPALILSLLGCNNPEDKTPAADTAKKDTVVQAQTFYLEDLLKIKDEAGLKQKLPQSKITYDTIWGAEGVFTMGTYIDKGTKDEVEIMWKDSAARSGMAAAHVEARSDKNGKMMFDNKWTSRSGVMLGMEATDLEKLNGKPFYFFGLDWDYGGGIVWDGGTLEKAKIGASLGHNPDETKLTEAEFSAIEGDKKVNSDNPAVRKARPVLVEFAVNN